MKVKKLFIGFMLLMLAAVPTMCLAEQVPDSVVKMLVNKYKTQNYLGCIQDSEKIIKLNPSNIFAHYYQGLSYIQIGKKDAAIAAFEKVQTLNSNPTLVEYAARGTACLNNPEECKKNAGNSDELDSFIKSNKFYDKSVQTEVNKKRLERMKDTINDELGPQKSEMPTNDQIAEAVKTLAKAGINPLGGTNNAAALAGMYTQSPEMQQMNMLLGNNNNQNNMLPMLLMNQNGSQKISPEMIQTMMMSQMTPDFGGNQNNMY